MRFISRVPRYALFASLCSVLSTPLMGWAADAPQTNSTARTSEVVVTATRTERERFDVAASIATISREEIQRKPRPTVAEILRDIPGIELADSINSPGVRRVTIRGESATRVLILVDGIKIPEQKGFEGSQLLIGTENIERIEVIKGPASVLYGSEAIGGVVNIITKKGGERPVQGSVSTTYNGSNDATTVAASMFGSYKGFNYRVSGDHTDAADRRTPTGKLEHTDYLQQNQSLYLDYNGENFKVGAGYDRFWSNLDIYPANGWAMSLPKWQRERLYGFAEASKISEYLQKVRITTFTQTTEKDRTNLTPVSHSLSDSEVRGYGGTLQTDWTFGDAHYVVAGLDYAHEVLDAADVNLLKGTSKTYDAYQDTLALFLQDEWSLHDDWTATLGLRQTWVETNLEATTDPLRSPDKTNDAKMVGSVGLVFSGFEDWRLRGVYAQGYRAPNIQELYIGSGAMMLPNAELSPERSQTFELGARYEANGVESDFSVYYTRAKDYIDVWYTPTGTFPYVARNVQGADTYGAELELAYTYEPWRLTPYVQGAFMYRVFDEGDGRGETALTNTPRWSGKTGVRYEADVTPSISFHADAFLRMASSARSEEEETGGWSTLNVAVGTRFGENKEFFANLNLNNIADKRYITRTGELEEPGFHAVLNTGVEF